MVVDRNFVLSQVFGVAGMICLAFGFLGFDGSGESIHPALGDRRVALGLIGTGAVLVMLELRILIPALRARARSRDQSQ